MSGPVLVGLAGRKRAGKSTVAYRLATAHGYCRVGFADPLKQILLHVNPRLESGMGLREYVARVGWEEAKDERPEVRRMLQDLGMSVREHVGVDTWVSAAMERVWRAGIHGWNVVVTDVRYPNEIDAIHTRGGLVCWVDRPDLPDDGDRHPSETSLTATDCDMAVVNRGSLDDLWAVADNLAAALNRYDLAG